MVKISAESMEYYDESEVEVPEQSAENTKVDFRDPIRRLGFVQLEHIIGLDIDLSDGAYRTLAILHFFSQQKDRAWPSIKLLADLRGKSQRAVTEHIAELAKKGLITRERRMSTSSMTYIEELPEEYVQAAMKFLEKRDKQKTARKSGRKLLVRQAENCLKRITTEEEPNEQEPSFKSPADNSYPQPVDNYVETLAEESGDLETLFRAEEESPGIVVQRVDGKVPLTPEEAAKKRIEQAMAEFAETGGNAGVSDPKEQKALWVREVASKISSVLGYRAVTKDCLTVAGRLWGRNFKKYDDSTATEAEILGRLDFYIQSGEYKNKNKVNPYLVPRILENDFARAPDQDDTATGLVISV